MASDEKKILLVEDEKAIRDVVAAYLDHENYIVRGVGDGQSAVEEFEKHSFDLVILDLMLPKLSGERVCRAIRETSNVPIIMLTAKGEVEESRHWPRAWCRRLSHQALFAARAHRARARAAPPRPHRDRAPARGPGLWRPGHRHLWPQGHGRGQGGRPHGLRVQAPHHACTLSRSRLHPHGAGREGPWLRLRGLRAHHRLPRQEPARQAGRRSHAIRAGSTPFTAWAIASRAPPGR